MSNLNHTIPTDDLVRAGYHERLVIEIDRRDPELMSLVIVKRTLLNHSIATVNLDGGSEVSETSRETSAVTSDRDSSAEASTTADISTPDGLTALATLNAKRAIEISPVVAAILARTNINVSTRTNPTSHGQRPANSGSTSILHMRAHVQARARTQQAAGKELVAVAVATSELPRADSEPQTQPSLA
ncbi:hypothetical protein BJY04DRAFT_222924 [Aspergillus karnatakaensis]|uniref:uncharacterized protein n=1 Tax=Aspergillus karnatakaensis TaxID=1810916 RepID=UPI003CCDF428